MLGRLARNHEIHPGKWSDPVASFNSLYFDTVLFDAPTLQYLNTQAGADKIMLGSDYPFPIGDPAPTKIVEAANLGEAETTLILGDTAARIFKIKPV